MAFVRAQSTLQITRRLLQAKSACARHKNEIPNTPKKSLWWGQIYKWAFLKKNGFCKSKTAHRLVAPWPHHKPGLAILVVPVPTGTDMQGPRRLSIATEVENLQRLYISYRHISCMQAIYTSAIDKLYTHMLCKGAPQFSRS